MNPKNFKTWFISATVLFLLVLASDFYVFHYYFKNSATKSESGELSQAQGESVPSSVQGQDNSFLTDAAPKTPDTATNSQEKPNNFLETLKACYPEIAAQTIATPEALLEYLSKTVGTQMEVLAVENYHIKLPDGTINRIHVLQTDDTEHNRKEVRYFTLDEEGYPVRDFQSEKENLEALLGRGTPIHYEVKSTLHLKDKSTLELEKHDNKVHELVYRAHGKSLFCAEQDCLCR